MVDTEQDLQTVLDLNTATEPQTIERTIEEAQEAGILGPFRKVTLTHLRSDVEGTDLRYHPGKIGLILNKGLPGKDVSLTGMAVRRADGTTKLYLFPVNRTDTEVLLPDEKELEMEVAVPLREWPLEIDPEVAIHSKQRVIYPGLIRTPQDPWAQAIRRSMFSQDLAARLAATPSDRHEWYRERFK